MTSPGTVPACLCAMRGLPKRFLGTTRTESRQGAEGLRDLDLFINRAAIQLVPVDAEQAHVACRRPGDTRIS